MKGLKLRLLALIVLVNGTLFAAGPPDEGMWLPLFIKDYNYAEMQRLGLKLTPEQIYSVNTSSLKDAIVQLGGFCTGEIISDQGLMLTNHHCGFDAIASQSTEEHNYLDDGFWAMNKGEELPIEGLSVTFLKSMYDVTDRVMGAEEAEKEIEKIVAEYNNGGKYKVDVEVMFEGNAYYVFVYEVYSDIRLVGAPPSSIGKFGGDTDNWMWPRHTGDFSMFRIYAAPDNSPAAYDENNVPYNPNHFLPVSTAGMSEGDFTMIMGYPGRTNRYLTSPEVVDQEASRAPVIVEVAGEYLEIMKTEMDKSEAVRIANASDYASMANTHKYYQGQLRGLKKFDLTSQQKAYEKELNAWINADEARKEKYGNVIADIKVAYENNQGLTNDMLYLNFAGFSPNYINLGFKMFRAQSGLSEEETIEKLREGGNEFFAEYNTALDRNMMVMALDFMKKMSADRQLDIFESDAYMKKGTNEAFADLIFKKSIFTSSKRWEKFLKKPSEDKLANDPGMMYLNSLMNLYRGKLAMVDGQMKAEINGLRKLYMQAIQEMEANAFYPDANFTMRVTYGSVMPYDSWEGKPFETFTYASQILDKYVDGDAEFDVPEKLRTLIAAKDFGDYANEDGTLNVCFLHNTDITGGNSGSPVINANGELIGCAFDGNWESMTSDLFWQDEYVRTISVDIRYVLFIIDKFAGAGHLVEEMKLVK